MKLMTILFSLISFILGSTHVPPNTTIPATSVSQEEPVHQKTITTNDKTYAYDLIGPVNGEQVTLFSNLPEKKSSQELKESHSCTYLINAGFYGTNNKPIGLFISDGIVKNEQIPNTLFNAFIAQPLQGKPVIQNNLPDTDISFALQSGPQLIDSGSVRTLKLTQDEEARRMMAGIDEKGNIYFFSVFSEDNTYHGPLLVDLPVLMQSIAGKEHIQLKDALNLDGGNHSAFYGKDTQLNELSPIGSFFCIK